MVRHDRSAAAVRLAAALGVDHAAWCNQVHGETVLRVEQGGLAGEGDALLTGKADLALLAVSADCPLVLLADPAGQAVGMVHASWRSTVRGIAARSVRRMREDLAVDCEGLIAAICPSAGPCCYQVGPEVREAALAHLGPQAEGFFLPKGSGTVFDLWSANVSQLIGEGLKPENIHVAGICTICSGEVFPSHRRQGVRAGRFAAAIARSSR
jgi:hypothetical protein